METIDTIKNEFLNLADSYYKAQLEGDWKKGNKFHKKLMEFYKNKGKNFQNMYIEYINHANDWVRLWAATFLLKSHPDMAIGCLQKLSNEDSIISNFSELILTAFKGGDLII